MSKLLAVAVMLAGLGGLAGCSHSCVPPGWYEAKTTPPIHRPPNAPPITHDSSYDIPGGQPAGQPTHDEACLVQPPNAVTTAPAATAKTGAAAGAHAKNGGRPE